MLDGLSSDMVVKAMGVVRKRPSENINKVYTVCCMCMYSCLLIHVHIYARDFKYAHVYVEMAYGQTIHD